MRTVLVLVCTLVIAALFAAIVRQAWQSNADASRVVSNERSGVVFMHPLTGLIGALVGAQSAAVRGVPVDTKAVRSAIDNVATADGKVGAVLGTGQRFIDLRSQIETILTANSTGQTAYDSYSGVIALAIDLVRQVGDSSNLIHDADLDSFYLMDAALVRLPSAMEYAGQAADLVAIAGGRALTGDAAIAAAVARFSVASAAEQVSAGISKAVDTTSRAALGENLAPLLDAFRAAVDAFAPPTMLSTLANAMDPQVLAAAANQVFATGLPLAHKLLSELDAVLALRQGVLAANWRYTAWCTAGAAVAGLLLLWVAIVMRTGRRGGPSGDGPASRRQDLFGSLTDARSLLNEELVTAGREAALSRLRERGDAQ
jgi:hypothetical protein